MLLCLWGREEGTLLRNISFCSLVFLPWYNFQFLHQKNKSQISLSASPKSIIKKGIRNITNNSIITIIIINIIMLAIFNPFFLLSFLFIVLFITSSEKVNGHFCRQSIDWPSLTKLYQKTVRYITIIIFSVFVQQSCRWIIKFWYKKIRYNKAKILPTSVNRIFALVEVTGFEPAASTSRT